MTSSAIFGWEITTVRIIEALVCVMNDLVCFVFCRPKTMPRRTSRNAATMIALSALEMPLCLIRTIGTQVTTTERIPFQPYTSRWCRSPAMQMRATFEHSQNRYVLLYPKSPLDPNDITVSIPPSINLHHQGGSETRSPCQRLPQAFSQPL